MPGPCANCGDKLAPFGFRRKGPFSAFQKDQQTMIFVCDAAPCMARAKAWKAKVDGADNFRRAANPKPSKAPDQGSLF